MYTIPPKKMVIINILEILKKYSDADHRLTQAQIGDYLKSDYMMEVDRKTIKRNLQNLLDLDCGIEYTEIMKTDKNGEEAPICTDWYIARTFDDSELRLLIDSVLFSKNIPSKQCKQLIHKLEGLSNVYFKGRVKHVCNLPENRPENPELFYTIDVLDEAISKNKKVEFVYNTYGTDKKLHPKRERTYVVSPYQMAATNGRYYLICNYDKYDNIDHYRIDHITKIQILKDSRKLLSALSEKQINLPKHMAEHVYMFGGKTVRAKFRAPSYIIDQIVDWFGTDTDFKPLDGETVEVLVDVNENAFFCWAMQYGMHIEVLEPLSVRERVVCAVKDMAEKYGV